MEHSQSLFVRDLAELENAMKLMPRQGDGCVVCDDTSELTCSCEAGKECQFTVPLKCSECPKAVCIAVEDSSDPSTGGGNNDSGNEGPNAGAIAGGVIGGLAVISILIYLCWRYFIKPRRAERGESMYAPEINPSHGSEKDAASRLTRRSSTHTVHSIASTVLTRASNIIQIAYIPGVTNRAANNDPGVLVPPVPPIPMQHAGGRESQATDDPHFFVPGDLRDSTYSGFSGYSDRTSYAGTSYAPRSSIASTIYGKQAQVMTGTQGGLRVKPTMVSVKSMGGQSPTLNAPPVPDIDYDRFGNARPKSTASAFSVGSTFLNNATPATATQARAQVVKVGGLKKIEVKNKSSNATLNSQKSPATSSVELDASPASQTAPTVKVEQSPFSDPPEVSARGFQSTSTPTLGPVQERSSAEEERADKQVARPGSKERDSSPFGDEHATK